MNARAFLAFWAAVWLPGAAWSAEAARPAACRPGALKALLIGLDGATWSVADPMLRRGELPNLKGLLARGARSPLQSLPGNAWSPVVWTSLATGQRPEKTGINGLPQDLHRFTSDQRSAPAFWDILGGRGYRVLVSGYLATWPPETVNGVMLSRPCFGKLSARCLYPADAGYDYRDFKVAYSTAGYFYATLGSDPSSRSEVGPIGRLPFDPRLREAAADSEAFQSNDHVWRLLTQVYVGDERYARGMEHFLSTGCFDFAALTITGTDSAAHMFWRYHEPEGFQLSPDALRRYGDPVEAYYRYADEVVGRLLRSAGPQTTVFIVSDHGEQSLMKYPPEQRERLLQEHPFVYSHHNDAGGAEGILIAAGPRVAPGRTLRSASVLDVLPTLLYLLDLPVARDMDGSVLEGLVSAAYLSSHPVRWTGKYPAPVRAVRGEEQAADTKLSPDELELLRASGYIR
ncbi:MAG: alkaline phosphatase family protein [Elusimicrobia bacterium]|nr:alkaline phosphatase family protein [Elusimicrobiota bacterium]